MTLSSPQRRWSFRLAALLLASLVLLGLDRLVYTLWYVPTYDDFGVPQDLSRYMIVEKGFLRFVPDRWLEDRYQPDMTLKLNSFNMITGDWIRYTLRTNNLGFRGPDIDPDKPPNTLRVVAMGGSAVMGQGVAEAQTYTHQLGRLLARHFPKQRVEMINAGVQGYASRHGFRQYARDLRPLRPDLLVVAYDVNDGTRPFTVEQVAAWKEPEDRPRPPPAHIFPHEQKKALSRMDELSRGRCWYELLYQSGFFLSAYYARAWVRKWLTWEEGKEVNGYSGPLPDPARKTKLYCPKERVLGAVAQPWDPNILWYWGNMLALDKLARQDRVPVIYLSIPMEGFSDLQPAYPYSEVMAKISASRPDRRHVSPAALFCGHALDDVMIDYCHPSPLGHAIIARALEPEAVALLRQRILD